MTTERTEIQFVLGLDVSRNTVTLYDDRSRCTLTVANDADALRTALQPYQGTATLAVCEATGGDLAPKFYPVLSSLQRFMVAVFGAVAAGCGAEPFRLRSTASRRGSMV